MQSQDISTDVLLSEEVLDALNQEELFGPAVRPPSPADSLPWPLTDRNVLVGSSSPSEPTSTVPPFLPISPYAFRTLGMPPSSSSDWDAITFHSCVCEKCLYDADKRDQQSVQHRYSQLLELQYKMRQFEVHTIVNPGDSAGAKKLKKRLKADLEYYAVDERQQQRGMDGLRTVCRAGQSGDWTGMFHSDRAGESEDLSMPGQRMLNARSGEDVTGEKEETSESRYAHLFDTSGPNASHSRTVAESPAASMRSVRVEARVEPPQPPSFPQPAHSSRVPDPLAVPVPSTLLGHPVDEALEKQYRDLVQSYSPYMQEHLGRMLSSNYSEQAPVRLLTGRSSISLLISRMQRTSFRNRSEMRLPRHP